MTVIQWHARVPADVDDDSVSPLEAVDSKFPHLPSAYVFRPRLTERLERGAHLPLTLVCAPAGSGKTTLASSWARQRSPRHLTSWLSLDPQDASRARFWAEVITCLCGHGFVLDTRLRSVQAVPDLLAQLCSALTESPRPVTLVLEAQAPMGPQVAHDLDFVLRHCGRRLHVVLLTCVSPPLPLNRYRSAGTLAELRSSDLLFSERETSALLSLLATNEAMGVSGPRRTTPGAPRARHPAPGVRTGPDSLIEPLTAKEIEVLGHLSELLSTEEIAEAMFVSVNTVRTHVRGILRKLAVSRRNQAVRRARAMSLIDH